MRRIFEMVARAVNFSDAQPDTDAGHAVLVARLKEVRVQMEQVAAAQRAGLIDVHTGAVEKRRLRREMLAGPIAHLAEVGRLAGRDHPDLVNKFRYKPSGHTYVAHRTAARSMQTEAETHKEVLAKYGLSEAVLEVFGQLLDRLDGAEARQRRAGRAHGRHQAAPGARGGSRADRAGDGRAEPIPVQE